MKTLANPADRTAILERIALVSPSSSAQWGKMNSHQMICHLGDAFRVALGQKTVSPARLPVPKTVMKWFALYAPFPWPKGVPTRPEIEQGRSGTRPTQFARDRVALLDLMEKFCDTRPNGLHPIFHRMSEKDWQRWAYLHMDHHLRQFGA